MKYYLIILTISTIAFAIDPPKYNHNLPDPPNQTAVLPSTNYFEKTGFPGICRGFMNIGLSPFTCPTVICTGTADSLKDKTFIVTNKVPLNEVTATIEEQYALEITTNKNNRIYATGMLPFTLAANAVVGSVLTSTEILNGVTDLLTFGYYGVPTEKNKENYSPYPHFIQAIK